MLRSDDQGGYGRGLAGVPWGTHALCQTDSGRVYSIAASGVPHSARHAGTSAKRDAAPADRQGLRLSPYAYPVQHRQSRVHRGSSLPLR